MSLVSNPPDHHHVDTWPYSSTHHSSSNIPPIWIVYWPLVICLPPIIYIAGWIFIIFGLPILYIVLWCMILVGPWVFVALGSVSGPILALKIPFTMLKYNYYNPVEMWSNMRRGMAQVTRILKYVDRNTASLSIGNIKLIKGA